MATLSPMLIAELRVLHRLLTTLRITIESEYIPSAVNRYADRPSQLQSWDDRRINQQTIRPLLKHLPEKSTDMPQRTIRCASGSNELTSHHTPW